MKIDTRIRYQESFLPTKRHKIPRIRTVEEDISVELREISRKDAPLAMVVTDYKSYLDENGKDQFGLKDTAFLAVDGLLYSEKRDMSGALDRGSYTMDMFLHDVKRHRDSYFSLYGRGKEDAIRSLNEFVDSHVLIDGILHEERNEPRYVVQTFGLGHNHGGTAMMITMHYNPNLSKDCYFSALERNDAIACANKVATARGDTKYVGTFDKDINIEVYMPEMVRCNPQLEHGEGDPFMNSIQGLIQGSGSAMEAGLLVMAATQAEISEKGSDIDSLLDDAEKRSKETEGIESGRDNVDLSK